jgi:hypothetical protein
MVVNKKGEEMVDSFFDKYKPLPTYCEAKYIQSVLLQACETTNAFFHSFSRYVKQTVLDKYFKNLHS